MGQTLESLQRLSAVEQKRAAIRRVLEAKTRVIETKRKNLAKIDERFKANQLAARELQSRIDAQSLDLASREDSISKHRDALNKAKTNKEYSAILAAMNTEKADNSKQEGEILKLMDEQRLLKEAGTSIEGERARAAQELAAAEAVAAQAQRDCQAELNSLLVARNQWVDKVPAGALAVFDRIAERHDGEALAAVTRPFPKREEYSCSGCNMKVTLDVVNVLKNRDEILTCSVCGRILFLESSATSSSRE